jgi:Tol biopolymer transport system component
MGSRLKAFVAFRRPIPPLLLAAGVILALALPGSAGAAAPGKIAFVSSRDGNDEIYVMNADGSGQTRLTTTANNVADRDPSWSPDGKQIAWITNRENPVGGDRDVWIMNADGSNPRQITFNDRNDFSLDWSPDGRSLIYAVDLAVAGQYELHIINVDGTGDRLFFNPATVQGAFGAHFSPDGQLIAFTFDTTTEDNVFLVNADGSGLRPFSNTASGTFDGAPDFTGDGKRVVFYTQPDLQDNEIVSQAIDGSGFLQLTNNSGPDSNDSSPSPSRDGLNRIAFSSDRGGDQELYVMNADGSGVTPLTDTTPGTNRGPDWQPTAVCQGKVATIVGTSAPETLTGGPGADIISGQGGKDQISGLAGKDIICGDAGKDTLKGGKGKDVLNGGKANDKLIGGKGKDKCIGGKGKKDTGKSCEKEKKIP